MQFTNITKAIHDAWTFGWPPLVMCGIAFCVSRYLNADGTQEAIKTIAEAIKTYGSQLNSMRSLLEPYGLTKLIPVVSAVAVVGCLYIVNGPLTIVASKLPPHISYRPDALLERSMSDNEKLVLLRKHPTVNSFNAAYYMAVREHKVTSSHTSSNRAELNYKVENFLKFAILVALVLVVVNIRSGVSFWSQCLRLVLLLVLLTPLWCLNFVSLLRNQENQFHDEWAAVRVNLLTDSDKLLEGEKSETEEQVLQQLHRDRGQRWWRVYLFDPYSITWFKYTFLPQKE